MDACHSLAPTTAVCGDHLIGRAEAYRHLRNVTRLHGSPRSKVENSHAES